MVMVSQDLQDQQDLQDGFLLASTRSVT